MFGFLIDMFNADERRVEQTTIGQLFVSTMRVSDGSRPFETAVRHPDYNDNNLVIVECYYTRDEAEDGHGRWVATMMASELPEYLDDCANSGVAQLLVASDGEMRFYRQAK